MSCSVTRRTELKSVLTVLVLTVTTLISAHVQITLTYSSLPLNETKVLSFVSGSEAYLYDLQLEDIALSHYAFRSAGSLGANEAADWIASQFESFGLEVNKEEFQFTSWDLNRKPTLIVDSDGNLTTPSDQNTIKSFQALHYSLPVDVFTDLVILPLPPAENRDEVGTRPIGTLWNSIDTTGKVVLIGYEVRFDYGWEEAFNNKLIAQPPVAVIHTWWYDWMSFVPDRFSSAGGRPVTQLGTHYFWESDVAAGFVNYDDGFFIRNIESEGDISAKVVIDSVVHVGSHFNVVGRLAGYEEPDKSVIISGHYDTVMTAGFCDNGAGTAGVIELAHVFTRAVQEGFYCPRYTLLFVAFAAEEIGLVGSINYVAQHKSEMENIVAVINLDSIGSDILEVTTTQLDEHGIDLDQIVLDASDDLGVTTQSIEPGGSDEVPFLHPPDGDDILMWWWGMSLGIGDAYPVRSSCMLISYPYSYGHTPPGWIHTSYDNSSSTETLNWVEVDDLESHIKVAALTVMRVDPPVEYVIARFSHKPEISWANETVTFDAAGSYSPNGIISSYIWSFADENVTVTGERTINYTFSKQGNYNVTLEVVDEAHLRSLVSYIVNVTYRTDLNKDSNVNILDISIVAMAFGSKEGEEYYNVVADLDENNEVNIIDISMVALDYGKTV